MKFSIILCHFRTGMMTAYTISQILKHKGRHEVEIRICDNNPSDGSIKYLKPFKKNIKVIESPAGRLQSHGIGYGSLMYLSGEWIIAMESDSFPVKEGWLDYYEKLIKNGYESAGSILKLSGGTYLHPAGALYHKSRFVEASKFCFDTEYFYYPNMCMANGFACHLMIRKDVAEAVLENPDDYFELADGYKPYTRELAESKRQAYSPTVGAMHNGMGGNDESVLTYGLRDAKTEVPTILLEKRTKIIKRVGYEPGQFMYYFQVAKGVKIFEIPTEVHWLPGKENQQQEYTLTENGVKHLWGISAYHGVSLNDEDVAKVKQSIPEQLYNTLPEHQKIKL